MWSGVSNSVILRGMDPKKRSTFLFVAFLGTVIATFFFSYAAFGEKQEKPTLKSVHIVFRHGARTPSSSYPNDPYKNKIWLEGFGALTNLGKTQLYEVGRFLRKRYGSFLGERYVEDQLSVLSSYSPRAQMSALTLLAGLFPPIRDQIWNQELPWQPIPVNQIPRHMDKMIAAKAPCKGFDAEKNKSDTDLNMQMYEDNKKLYNLLTLKSGLEIKSIADVENLFYILSIQEDNNLEMPEWAKNVLPQMTSLAALNLASYTFTDRLKMFQGGPMLKDWVSHLKASNGPKLHLYSGHDLTLVNIMRTLGFTESFLPKYGAGIIVELHEDKAINEDKFLKLLYLNSSSSTEPHNLILPECALECPLGTFITLYNKYMPQDWEKECEL